MTKNSVVVTDTKREMARMTSSLWNVIFPRIKNVNNSGFNRYGDISTDTSLLFQTNSSQQSIKEIDQYIVLLKLFVLRINTPFHLMVKGK